MKLGDVVGGAYSEAVPFADLAVTGISSDSRTVAPGNLFFAFLAFQRTPPGQPANTVPNALAVAKYSAGAGGVSYVKTVPSAVSRAGTPYWTGCTTSR